MTLIEYVSNIFFCKTVNKWPKFKSHSHTCIWSKTEQNAILLTLKSVVFRVQACFKEISKEKEGNNERGRVRETMSTENSIQCIWHPNVIVVPITLKNRFVWVLSTVFLSLFFSRVRLSQTRATTTTKYFNRIFHRFHYYTLAAQN